MSHERLKNAQSTIDTDGLLVTYMFNIVIGIT